MTELWERYGAHPSLYGWYMAEELSRFNAFEFICAYQYPGIFCAPDAAKQPGGAAAVRLFQDYQRYLEET